MASIIKFFPSLDLHGKSLGFIALLVIIRNLGYELFGLRVRNDRRLNIITTLVISKFPISGNLLLMTATNTA